jgi:hypothetical protein
MIEKAGDLSWILFELISVDKLDRENSTNRKN